MRLAFAVLIGGWSLGVALAAIFSGSVLAPIFSMPVAAITGLTFAILLTRDDDRKHGRR